jgi:hypothetical protein
MDIARLSTLLSLGCELNMLFGLEQEGINVSFVDLFIPALATQFGGGLIANLVHHSSTLTPECMSLFLIGLLLFSVIHKITAIKQIVKICPIIGKSLSFVGLKNSKTPFYLIVGSLLAGEVAGKLINKLLLNKQKIENTPEDLTRNFVLITSIIIGRVLNIPDFAYFSFIFVISILPMITEFIKTNSEIVQDINKNKRSTLKSQIESLKTK